MFSNRNSLEAHAKGFWDYHSFITASALFQPYGFGTTYINWNFMGTKEIAAFLAHVGIKTSCGHKVATKEQLDWSLCCNKEMNSNSDYRDEHYKNAYPCALGVAYYGRWMKPIKEHQPSAHDVFTGYWTPTKNDTLAKRLSGFGATMNVLYGDLVCGKGDNESVNNIISHYLSYLDLMGVGREGARPHDVLSCAKQVVFNPSSSSSP
ncbi:hypothetical protein SO802_013129 [Lithocarpus litseifolius]|uniref:Glycoside hydrolase family 19 catalytic domain-containing protein n=1 Tax=Lithocarpus litseifolius TaxID=425828 RepID=A0AAW2D4R7_9ROSI